MKKIMRITSIVIISSTSLIYSGGYWSKQAHAETDQAQSQTTTDPMEAVKSELNTYLNALPLKSPIIKEELEEQIQNSINQDLRDSIKFPQTNACILKIESTKDVTLEKKLGETVYKSVSEFVDKKIKNG